MRNRTRKPPKNLRESHYNRVLMAREAERRKKFGAWCGLALILILAIGLAIALTGCAAKKPVRRNAHMVIPRTCAEGFEWTSKTVCKSVDPEHAMCSNVLVKHWCVQPAK